MYETDSMLASVTKLSKQVLTIPTVNGNSDITLWDRARRLVCNVEYIIELPELSKFNMQVDRFCLMAATYFSDSGLAHHFKLKNHTEPGVFGNNGDDLVHSCSEIVLDKLSGLVKDEKIEKINSIISEAHSNFAQKPESMILSDARNLDDMGAAGLFQEFRRYTVTGKSISDALQIWKRKIDYRYWQARLKESFRFASVRKLAEQRLGAAEHFMNQLNIETEGLDLEELSDDPAFV